MMSWPRILCLILLIAMLIGCGVRSTYNNLDWLALRWLNQQINLSAEQEQLARNAIDRKLAWHCERELPDYIALIQRIDRDVASNNITVATLDQYGDEINAFGRRLLKRAQPTVTELLASLDDQQVEDLIAGIEERNEELVAELVELSPEARNEERVERMDSYLRRLFGRLNSEQQKRLDQWVLDRQPTAEFQRHRREARDQLFIQALAVRNDTTEFEQHMSTLFQPEDTDWDVHDEFNQRTAHNRDNMLNTLVDIYGLAGDRQIDRLRDRLDDLAEDFREVSCRARA